MFKKKSSNLFFKATIVMMIFASIAFFLVTLSLKNADAHINELEQENSRISEQTESLLDSISDYKDQLVELNLKKNDYQDDAFTFFSEIESLEEEIVELEEELNLYLNSEEEFPFAVPSSGFLPNYASGYGENMRGMQHFAVDIWTTTENYGMIPSHKGNPVYSACDGRVASFDHANGAIIILCNEISGNYDVPAYKNVYTYYGHMGNGETKETFFTVGQGQSVEKGQLIGYQGDLSKFFPDMRNVHLHFQLWAGSMNFSSDSSTGPHNPCLYIGGDCNTPGTVFVANE